ncbi:MAG: DUF3137 domain-containing protein [Candidatus Gastranaerophilaceae bacterium]
MTIPSIGGNGNNLNKIQINPIANDIQNSLEQAPIQAPTEEPASQTAQPSQQAEDKEYSIEQFKKDYIKLLEEKVMPVLLGYEDERKKRLKWAIIAAVFCSIAAICIFFFIKGRGSADLAGIFITAACGIWFWIKKSFEKKIKKTIMPTLMQAVPGFYWQETPAVKAEEIEESMIIPFAKKCNKRFDDCFIGKYRDVKVAISECEYELGSGNRSKTILEGVVIKFEMNKNFEGSTVIRPRKPQHHRDKYDDLKRAKMSEVKLEDPEFDKKYVVYSTDQIESRYLLTTAFMERFKQIETAFESYYAYCSFYKDSVFIAPHTDCDLFNLCSLVKPIGNREQFETLFNEFASILALVDHFKLDKKLGL